MLSVFDIDWLLNLNDTISINITIEEIEKKLERVKRFDIYFDLLKKTCYMKSTHRVRYRRIDALLESMKLDLYEIEYSLGNFDEFIFSKLKILAHENLMHSKKRFLLGQFAQLLEENLKIDYRIEQLRENKKKLEERVSYLNLKKLSEKNVIRVIDSLFYLVLHLEDSKILKRDEK